MARKRQWSDVGNDADGSWQSLEHWQPWNNRNSWDNWANWDNWGGWGCNGDWGWNRWDPWADAASWDGQEPPSKCPRHADSWESGETQSPSKLPRPPESAESLDGGEPPSTLPRPTPSKSVPKPSCSAKLAQAKKMPKLGLLPLKPKAGALALDRKTPTPPPAPPPQHLLDQMSQANEDGSGAAYTSGGSAGTKTITPAASLPLRAQEALARYSVEAATLEAFVDQQAAQEAAEGSTGEASSKGNGAGSAEEAAKQKKRSSLNDAFAGRQAAQQADAYETYKDVYLKEGTPWYGKGGADLFGPITWKCPRTGRKMRYLAARVAYGAAAKTPCADSEPVLLYLAGLGDAGERDPSAFRKRHRQMLNWGLPPFLFLAPLRTPGMWWCVQGEDDTMYGWLGELVSEELEALAGLVKSCVQNRPIVGYGFSAGAYCLSELLASAKIRFGGLVLGGLHGHGQSDVKQIPKRKQDGIVEKYRSYLRRLASHPGVPAGVIALHSEDDNWSPKKYAMPALSAIGARNVECGYDPLRFALLPPDKRRRGHDYENRIWQGGIAELLFLKATKAASSVRPRGTIAMDTTMEAPQHSDGVWTLPDDCVLGATWSALPAGESGNDMPQARRVAEPKARPRGELEGFEDEPWEESSGESDASGEGDCSSDDEEDSVPPAPHYDDEGEEEEESDMMIDDCRSAIFGGEPLDCVDWREVSVLDVASFTVDAEPLLGDIVSSSSAPLWAQSARDIFLRHGFVVLTGVVSSKKAREVLADCRSAAKKIVYKKHPMGNRHGGARYSFGKASSTGSMLHLKSFALNMLNNGRVLTVLESIFAHKPKTASKKGDEEEEAFGPHAGRFKCVSAGGDFVLAGESRFQRMHDDIGGLSKMDNVHFPPPLVSVNFVVQAIDADNGPLRIIPGTQLKWGSWKNKPVEPAEWRAHRLFPLPVGSVIIRDVRTLHGGSPNLSQRARFLPAVEFASERFLQTPRGRAYICKHSLPQELYAQMRPATQRRIHREVVAPSSIQVRPTFRSK